MNLDQQVIDLATRIQRRHDFSSHVTGFLCGAVILGALLIAGIKAAHLYLAAVLTWATALSFQPAGEPARRNGQQCAGEPGSEPDRRLQPRKSPPSWSHRWFSRQAAQRSRP